MQVHQLGRINEMQYSLRILINELTVRRYTYSGFATTEGLLLKSSGMQGYDPL